MTFWDDLYRQSQSVTVDEKALVATQLHHDLSQFAVVDVNESDWVRHLLKVCCAYYLSAMVVKKPRAPPVW